MVTTLFTGLLLAVELVAGIGVSLAQRGQGGFSVNAVKAHDYGDETIASRGDDKSSVDVAANWYIPVSIGTPPQSFLFLGDSGATGLALGSTFLPKDKQSNSPKYNPDNSTTAKKVDGYTYKLCFGSGFCSSGVVYQDTVTVGNLTIDDMHVEVQTNNTGAGSGARSGTLGLDCDKQGQTTHPKKVPNWLERVMPTLQSGVFTVDFDANTSKGTFDFGYVDSSKFSGSIGYADVKEHATLWAVNISKQVLANGTDANTDGWLVVVDTGTTGSNVPREVAADYFAQVDGAEYNDNRGGYTFPCSSSLVDFTFAVGSVEAVIPAAALKGKSIDGGKTCTSKMSVQKGNRTSLWGQTFIEQLFVVFDWDKERVGFANKGSGGSKAPEMSASSTFVSTASSQTSSATATSSESSGSNSNSAKLASCSTFLFSLVSLCFTLA